MCVFTDRKNKALALALVPIVAINIYAGCKMLNKTSRNADIKDNTSIEDVFSESSIPGETYLELDDSLVPVQEIEETDLLQDSEGNITVSEEVLEETKKEDEFTKLNDIFNKANLSVDEILKHEDRNSSLYASALYKKLKRANISDDVIRHELSNIIVYGSNATCMSDDMWYKLFGNLVGTISMYDNVVDYYYPLAKYVHLYSCDLEHTPLFFDEDRINCSKIEEAYKIANPEINIEEYFKEMILASEDIKLINQFSTFLESGIDLNTLLNELENVYICAMIPTDYTHEEWEMLFGNLVKTVSPSINVCIYYYDLAFYLHNLWCDLDHQLNEFGRYTCDAYSLTLEKSEI